MPTLIRVSASDAGWLAERWARFVAFLHGSPDPRHPTMRWALHSSVTFLRKRSFLVGLLLLPLAAAFAVAVFAPQANKGTNPSDLHRGVAAVAAYLVALVAIVAMVYLVCLVIAPYRQKRELVVAEAARAAARSDERTEPAPDPEKVRLNKLSELCARGYGILETYERDSRTIRADRRTCGNTPPDGITWEEWLDRVTLPLQSWMEASDVLVVEFCGDKGLARMRAYRHMSAYVRHDSDANNPEVPGIVAFRVLPNQLVGIHRGKQVRP